MMAKQEWEEQGCAGSETLVTPVPSGSRREFVGALLCGAAVAPRIGRAQEAAPRPRLTTAGIRSVEHRYKQTPQGDLLLHCFLPPGWNAGDRRPVIVFFFGGGWRNGTFAQFVPQAEYFAARGIVGISADYRILSRHRTTPDRCVEDARSALRWVRAHATDLGVDSERLIASGGSAGAHLAAACAFLPGFDDPADTRSISCRPNALVLYNPALDLIGRGILDGAGKDISREFSPTHFVEKGAPPTLLFFGTADPLAEQGRAFAAKSRALGNRAELELAANMSHGYFNRPPWLQATTRRADEFLASLGYLQGKPTVVAPDGA